MSKTYINAPSSIEATLALLAEADYLADRSLATVLFLALRMGRPLFLEGEAGVGKTEVAKVLAKTLGRQLIRLQCYEGLDVAAAVYEWNYGAQMITIRLAEAEGSAERELSIVRAKVPGIAERLSREIVLFAQSLRKEDLFKAPGVAETLDWAAALSELDVVALDPATVSDTLGVLLKYQDDIARLEGTKAKELLDELRAELRAAE